METVAVTMIVENTAGRPDLRAEHGLAVWIDMGRQQVLWDTGQSDLVQANALALNIPLETADCLVLRHGHYDHTLGLAGVLPLVPKAPVFLHPAAMAEKYARNSHGSSRSVGMSRTAKVALSNHPGGQVITEAVTEIVDGLFETGPIPRINDFEDTGGPFFWTKHAQSPTRF